VRQQKVAFREAKTKLTLYFKNDESAYKMTENKKGAKSSDHQQIEAN